ncbi:glucose-1-phosphate thymidylyltransferase [Streptomyces sp. NPDC001262]|uniref:glucose-1-phosphate thymidylyltransferase n=1 Tax=Streptomyces TaxID=1883 RepID=UPI00369CD701
MKALVLAGGSGTRLRPLSHSMPKQLVPVGDRPVLFHCLDALREAGITEVGVIVSVGPRGDEIRRAVGDGAEFGLQITCIPQDAPRGLADCVRIARPFLGDDDFVMYLGDNILAGGIAAHAEEFRRTRPAASVLLTRVADPRSYGIAQLAEDGRVTRLWEKPAEPVGDLALTGVYFFTPAVHEAVASIGPSARGELEITDALSWLVDAGQDVRGEVFPGYWKDTGRIEDVLECNRVLLDRLEADCRGLIDPDSIIVGNVVVEPGATVIRSTLVGPLVVRAGTEIRDSHVGPYVTLGRDGVLDRAGITDSIVMDEVSVVDVRGIHGSLIGRQARVRQAAAPASGHRLVLGDHTRIEVVA